VRPLSPHIPVVEQTGSVYNHFEADIPKYENRANDEEDLRISDDDVDWESNCEAGSVVVRVPNYQKTLFRLKKWIQILTQLGYAVLICWD
jgi:hypothetical protein